MANIRRLITDRRLAAFATAILLGWTPCASASQAAAVDPSALPISPGPTSTGAYAARILLATTARSRPANGARRVARIGTTATVAHGPVQLLVMDARRVPIGSSQGATRLWLRVALPIRPNGASAWIPADSARIYALPWRVHISTGRRTVTVAKAGRVVRRFRAVVGTPATPTPHGLFAINEAIREASPRGFVGPWVLQLTAFSNVLRRFEGGPGRVAIHGRDGASLLDPLGSARSHGCVRIADRDVRWLARELPLGTPVEID